MDQVLLLTDQEPDLNHQLILVLKKVRKLKKQLEEKDDIKYQLKQLKKKAKKLRKIIKKSGKKKVK